MCFSWSRSCTEAGSRACCRRYRTQRPSVRVWRSLRSLREKLYTLLTDLIPRNASIAARTTLQNVISASDHADGQPGLNFRPMTRPDMTRLLNVPGAQARFQSWGGLMPWCRLLCRTKYGWYTQFHALCRLLRNGNHTLHQKSWGGPSNFFFGRGVSGPPQPPSGCALGTFRTSAMRRLQFQTAFSNAIV